MITKNGTKISYVKCPGNKNPQLLFDMGPQRQIGIPISKKNESKENEVAYKAVRVRLFDAMDKILSSDDMKFYMNYHEMIPACQPFNTFGIVYGMRKDANLMDAVLSTPPGFGSLSYDRRRMDQFK